MIGKFNDIKEIKPSKFADSPLGKRAAGISLDNFDRIANKPIRELTNESRKNCPINDGKWTGERGDSTWKPDKESVPKKSNPEGKTWGELLKMYGIDGIVFKDGEPDFSNISKGEVKIKGFSENRADNFDKADIELAKQKGCTPEEVKKWRKENGYTWHECSDMETMQKVPSVIHNNIPHRGGISEAKKGE